MQPTEASGQDVGTPPREHGQLEQHARRNWFLLVATSILSTLGLGIAIIPLLNHEISEIWPWAYTNHTLLASLSLSVTALAWYLTQQERRVTDLRVQLLETRRRELRHCKSYGRAVASANAAMHREIQQRLCIEEKLRALNETLEERVDERSAVAEKHADAAQQAKISLEEQNKRLRELYQTARQFVDTVSHEFRTPLTVIREYASVLNDGLAGETNDTQREYLLTIMNRVDDMSTMVNDLLDVSRIEADLLRTSRRSCSVSEIIGSVRPTLERKALRSQVQLEFDIDTDHLPRVFCDTEKIGRVLINLTVNSIKFSRQGDSVSVWACLNERRTEVIIGVTDRGPGIAPENLEKIFDRFQQLDAPVQTSTKGFGLGLNIVRELVLLNFGSLNVESQLGKGSTFSFSLPRVEPEHLIPIYLDRVQAVRTRDVYVTLLEATADAESPLESLEEMRLLFEDNTRRTDLIYSSRAGTWLVAAASRKPGMSTLTQRMELALQEANDSERERPLPDVRWRVEGCWRIETEGEQFQRRFLSLCDPGGAPEPESSSPEHESRT